MSAGHLYMFLSLVCFSSIGICCKIGDFLKCRPNALIALMALWSFTLVSGTVLHSTGSLAVPAAVAAVAIPCGIFGGIAVLSMQRGVRYGKVSTSWLAINLSAAIPTVASILLYKEPLTTTKAIALLLIPVSMLLLWKDKKDEEERKH